MRKHQLCVVRKQGNLYRHFSIRFYRDEITGEYSILLSCFGNMLMICMEKVIPELSSLVYPYGRYPRMLPCGMLTESENIFRK